MTPVRWPRAVQVLLALAFACVATLALAQQQWHSSTEGLVPIPPLTARVTDLTGTLAVPEVQALDAKLAAWEQKTGNQLAVLLLPTTQGEPIEAYSIRVADAWKIGRKGQDNGVLMILAKNDKKLRIEVGYGLEGVLTDVTARRIIGDTMAPYLRNNQFAQGINAGVDQIIAVVDKGEPLAAKPAAKGKPASRGFPLEMMLIIVFVIVPIMGSILRRIFGRALGATVGAGIVGAGAWIVAGSLLIAIVAAVVALLVLLFAGTGAALAHRGGGVWVPGGFGGGSWGGGGGGGFSGGGGGFGGGGASGGWN
ncbi:MAG: YgcG family protein [Burkholderiales bacterium]